jgi:hypothetical protein
MTALGDVSKVHFSYRDRSGELTRSQLYFVPVDDSADNSSLLDQATGAIAIVGTALGLLTKLNQAGTNISIQIDAGTAGLPAAADAQREWAIRWDYQDTTTNKHYRFDTPGPIDAVVVAGTDLIDMGNALVIAFKAAFEADCKSPVGNAVVLNSGRIVGRRN